jgi:predicted SnoaL-like aldol condensation-catalyzing enzyme
MPARRFSLDWTRPERITPRPRPVQPTRQPPPARTDPVAASLAADDGVALYFGFVEEVMRGGETAGTSRFFASDFVEHAAPSAAPDAGLVKCLAARRTRFPDAVWTIELIAGVGGLVVCHTSVTCPAPAGCVARGWETVIVRIDAGRIAESWRVRDEWLRAAEDDGAR